LAITESALRGKPVRVDEMLQRAAPQPSNGEEKAK
jgi:hypothetical protein